MDERYNREYAIAVIRGHIKRLGNGGSFGAALDKPVCELTDGECEAFMTYARDNEIKLYHFKRSDRLLPRVHKLIGMLKGMYFESLLDVGSGRGVFLLPFMEEFPQVEVTSLDVLEKRYEMLCDLANGGVDRLHPLLADITEKPLPDRSVDAVTMLEVLEHIPDVSSAVTAALAIARRFIIVSVPSKEDDNPEHIHLLTADRLTALFNGAASALGIPEPRLTFSQVTGHLILLVTLR